MVKILVAETSPPEASFQNYPGTPNIWVTHALRDNSSLVYNTRNRVNYSLSSHHLAIYRKKPSYIGAKLSSTLPPIKQQKSNKNIKYDLLDWLTEKDYYSIEDYLEEPIQRTPHSQKLFIN